MTEPAQAALHGGTFPKRTSSLVIYEELKAKVKPQNSLRQPSYVHASSAQHYWISHAAR
jgi:hypothetical protein